MTRIEKALLIAPATTIVGMGILTLIARSWPPFDALLLIGVQIFLGAFLLSVLFVEGDDRY